MVRLANMLQNLIVPVLNRYDLLWRMIGTIDHPIEDLIIVDNGGDFETRFGKPDLQHVDRIHVIRLPSNLGVAASWNLGVKLLPDHRQWTFASNDIEYAPGDLESLSYASPEALTLCSSAPHWQTFVIGERIIDRVGLIDEVYYPAYFEDNDYENRVVVAGLPIEYIHLGVEHDNSSTILSSPTYRSANDRTFQLNRNIYRRKHEHNDWSEIGWRLADRRAKSWDPTR